MTIRQKARSKESQIAELADSVFASHQIEQRMYHFEAFDRYYGHWVCTKNGKGSNIYRFDIQHKPGTVTVTGDVGHLIIERSANMIAWCRGAVGSIGYFAEKVPRAIPTREPSQDKRQEYYDMMFIPCLAYCGEAGYNAWGQAIAAPEDREHWIDLREELAWKIDGPHDVFMSTLYESPLCRDSEWLPDLTDWTSNFLWCREAVKWFCEHWDGPNSAAGGKHGQD